MKKIKIKNPLELIYGYLMVDCLAAAALYILTKTR